MKHSPLRARRSISARLRSRRPGWRLSLGSLVLGCASCGSGDPSGLTDIQRHERPASLGGLALADASHLRDGSYVGTGHGANPIRGVRAVEVDRLDRALVIDQPQHGPPRLLRLNGSGSLDGSFSGNGTLILEEHPSALAVDSLDRIVVVGHVLVQPPGLPPAYSRPVAQVARFHDDGTPDLDFGTGGVVQIAAPASDLNSEALAVREDSFGGLLVFGHLLRPYEQPYVSGRAQEPEVFVARLTEDGTLDASYGTSGIARAAELRPSRMNGVDLDSGGRPVVTGHLFPDGSLDPTPVTVWRFQVDGTPDGTFASQGRFTAVEPGGGLPVSGSGTRVAHDSAGRILVAGNRLTDIGAIEDWPNVLADGKLGSPIYDVGVWRLTAQGQLDASYGSSGRSRVAIATAPFDSMGGDHFDMTLDLLIDDQDRALVAFLSEDPIWGGFSGYYTFQRTRTCLVRLGSTGSLDPTFLGGDPGRVSETVPVGMARDSSGRVLLANRDAGIFRLDL